MLFSIRVTGYPSYKTYNLFSTSGANAHLTMEANEYLEANPDIAVEIDRLLSSHDYTSQRNIARRSAASAISDVHRMRYGLCSNMVDITFRYPTKKSCGWIDTSYVYPALSMRRIKILTDLCFVITDN